MNICADIHTHTIVSGHAYSTLDENVRYAAEKNIKLLAATEHAPALHGAPQRIYFSNMGIIPKKLHGVEILMGVEANILDFDGTLDLDEKILSKMDIVIASLHTPCITSGTKEENTSALLKAMEHPCVDVIGHPGDPNFLIDIKEVFYKALETKTLLEINNASLYPDGSRRGSEQFMIEILELAKKEQTPVVLGSDAHFYTKVGDFDYVLSLFKKLNFPESLVLNTSAEKLRNALKRNQKV